MGLFVLHSSSLDVDESRLSELFARKGSPPPGKIPLGRVTLLFSERTGLVTPTWNHSHENWSLHHIGTVVYRSLGSVESVRRLLSDFARDSVDQSELVGSYCLIVFDGLRVRLQTDQAGLCHVFSNKDGTAISNSLQALLVADGRRHPLNRDALIEQLVTGSVAGPNTLFSDIRLMTNEEQRTFESPIADFSTADSRREDREQCLLSFPECVERQLEVLRGYFTRVSALSKEFGATLGVSGGYDSTLLLLLAREAGLPVTGHTYSSRAHKHERPVAEELARRAGIRLLPLSIRMWEQLDKPELAANMDDALHYWDGRTNMTMGSFNDVDTRILRTRAFGSAGLSLNGMGGELYRNADHLRHGRLGFGQWFRFFVMGPVNTAAIRDERTAKAFVARIRRKYARLMEVDSLDRFDLHLARRWYRDVWLPFSAGPRLCAENQLSFALMPFADSSVSGEALKATPHIGNGGAFEMAMIRALDPGMAGVTSSYGHSFDHTPLRAHVTDWVRSIAPLGERLRVHEKRAVSSTDRHHSANRMEPPASVQAGMRTLNQMNLPIDWDIFLSDRVNRDRSYYIAHFLSSFKSAWAPA